jgi:SAM-dependent MidA family methyltransferase
MSKPALIEALREEIVQKGPIPFARFMAQALYHPEQGYYTASDGQIGWKGDYYTSSTLHPVFGELIAKQLLQMARLLGPPDAPFSVLEMGAGKGTLCGDILAFIQREAPEHFARLRYHIIETSGPLRLRQQARISFPQVVWENQIPASFNGVIFSNEFLDALPVHRLKVGPAPPTEIYVDWQWEGFVEVDGPPSSARLVAYLDHLGLPFDRPATLEINLAAQDWMRDAGRALQRGFVLTIDYGHPAEDLYNTRRTRGTLLCYHQHTAHENPYIHVGEQDITAHVDFTTLARTGRKAGLACLGFTDQTHFLMGLGMGDRMTAVADQMETSDAARREFAAMKALMAPSQMGKIFKVLIQGKGVPADLSLDGLQFRPFFKDALGLDG